MKRILMGFLMVVLVAVLAMFLLNMYTRQHSPAVTVTFNHGPATLQLDYCSPSKKGREIFGTLVPYGEVWRTGANDATRFQTNQDLQFGEQTLPAGTYALFTIPTPEAWTIIFNSEPEQWGAFFHKPEKDVLRVQAMPAQAPLTEVLTLSFEEKEGQLALLITWDQTQVAVPFSVR